MAEQHLHRGHEGAWLLLNQMSIQHPRLAKSEEFWVALYDNGLVGSKLYTFFLTDCALDLSNFRDRVTSLIVRQFYAVPEKPSVRVEEERTPSPTSVAASDDWVYATP